jgi:hypothetical protein
MLKFLFAVECGCDPHTCTMGGGVVVDESKAYDALYKNEENFAVSGEGELLEEAVCQSYGEACHFELE